jgi:hypothetical protein
MVSKEDTEAVTLRGAITALLERRACGQRPDAWLVVRAPETDRYAVVPDGALSRETIDWLGACIRFAETELADVEQAARQQEFDVVEYLALEIEQRPESRAE